MLIGTHHGLDDDDIWPTDANDYELLGIVGRVRIMIVYDCREHLQKSIRGDAR